MPSASLVGGSVPAPLSAVPLRYAVLASGGGSNFQALLDRAAAGDLSAQAVFVASNNSTAPALDKARAAGVPTYHVSTKTEAGIPMHVMGAPLHHAGVPANDGVAARLIALLDEYKPDLLVLAGYMKKVPDAVLARMKNRVINIHPALLPEFGGAGMYGHYVHEAVVRAGKAFSGVTIHMVNEHYDEGQIILQRRVDFPSGTDAAEVGRRVLALEHDSYWRVLKAFVDGDIVPTGSDDPAKAVRISDDWKKRVRTLSGTVFP